MSGTGPSDLTLYADSTWMSPWVFHAMVALEEKHLPYKLEVVPQPIPISTKAALQYKAIRGTVPILAHGEFWLSESLAISEYLAETFPAPAHPRLFPADLTQRARARQIMLFLRTSLFALRDARPTSTVFGRPNSKPMPEKARDEAAELERVALALISSDRTTLFDEWCIADCDLALMLMRLVANQDPLDRRLVNYALAQFDRKSVRKFVAHLPTIR
ncbi:MAG TPA: glutathione transferase [Kofleriaceae bacterium]|nr:glutathione transferase [Kofleriaceae bacterium]